MLTKALKRFPLHLGVVLVILFLCCGYVLDLVFANLLSIDLFLVQFSKMTVLSSGCGNVPVKHYMCIHISYQCSVITRGWFTARVSLCPKLFNLFISIGLLIACTACCINRIGITHKKNNNVEYKMVWKK